MRHYMDNVNRFSESFDPVTGFYMRTGVLEVHPNKDDAGLHFVDTGVDPFMRKMPGLIDIGIMGHCAHAGTGRCLAAGVGCYQGGATIQKPNMSFENYKKIIDEVAPHVFQVALGGRGDPDMHENFEAILAYSREKGVIPNFTTSGLGMNLEKADICKKYCGAVAVSWYGQIHEGVKFRLPYDYTSAAINMLVAKEVITNIHYVLGNNTIDEAIYRLKNNVFPAGINAVIFLLHKPVGLGSEDNVLQYDDPRLKEFFELIDSGKFNFKIGFDSCSVPAILNLTKQIRIESVDTCEGGRFSMYISSDMIAVPCSFDQAHTYGVDLNTSTVEAAWKSSQFEQFRNKLRMSCPTCSIQRDCKGGCPIVKQIVLCNREEKAFA